MASYIRYGNNYKISCQADFVIYVSLVLEKTKLKKKEVFEDLLLEAFKMGQQVARLEVNAIDKP